MAALLGIVPLYWNPRVWADYFAMLRDAGIEGEFIPTISFAVRLGLHSTVAQYLPTFASCIWAAVYFWRRAENWNWNTDGALVLVVSVAAAPYAWFTDELVSLPVILAHLYVCSDLSARWFGFLNGIALVEVLGGVGMPSGGYMWTALAWLLWFTLSRAKTVQPVDHETAAV